MSHINVGFVNGRMNSRILKPPGGGYSEIFFEDIEPKTPPKKIESVIETVSKNNDESQIVTQVTTSPQVETLESILKSEKDVVAKHEGKTENNSTKIEETTIITTSSSTTSSSSSSSSVSKSEDSVDSDTNGIEAKIEVLQIENGKEKIEEPIVSTPGRRTRVPPGGFSSGLW